MGIPIKTLIKFTEMTNLKNEYLQQIKSKSLYIKQPLFNDLWTTFPI
jgi:hypothetical protein